MKSKHIVRDRPITWIVLAGGVLLGGCSPVAVDLGMQFLDGLTAALNSSGVFEALLESLTPAG